MSTVEISKTPRAPKLVRWIVYGLATLGGLAVLTSGMFPSPAFTALAIAIATASLAITLLAPDLFIYVTRPKGGEAPQVGLNPIAGIPAAVLFFRSIGMDLVDFGPSWIAAGICGATLAIAALLRRPVRTPIQLVIYMSTFGLLLGYGAATQANVRFDASPGDPYRATVMALHTSQGRTTTYTVQLSSWGPLPGGRWQDVPRSIYQTTDEGDSLCPRLHPGALHERWFTIDPCPP
ncbi:MAG TPA: hypothetical protein VGI95_01850 [Caulobacteraceae bacterium]|jgi:hypothetical protein